jgi:hypothetical protein
MDETLVETIIEGTGLDSPWVENEVRQIVGRIDPKSQLTPLEQLRLIAADYLRDVWLESQPEHIQMEKIG